MLYKKDFKGIIEDIAIINPRGFEMIVFTNAPSIGYIRRNYGEEGIIKVIGIQLNWLCDQLSIGKNMDGDKILTATEIIIDKFHQLTPMDLKLCFKRALSGDYGTIYDRLDVVVICEWLNKYFKERDAYAERIRMREHKSVEEKTKVESISDENFEKNIKPLFEQFKKVEEPTITIRKHEITPLQKLVSRWADQFGVLHRNISIKARFNVVANEYYGNKYLIIDGKNISKSDFINYKHLKNPEKVQQANFDSIKIKQTN